MIGIVSHAVYLPGYYIARETVAQAWQARSPAGKKVCARFDEDSLTLAATAAGDCLHCLATLDDSASVASLFFASTTPPYTERLNASLLAAFCDLPSDCLTADVTASLRAGTTALALAFDRVAATPGHVALVAAADTREAEPGSSEEMLFSDAAASVAVGDRELVAELVARASLYLDFFETTRRDRDDTVNVFAGKFSIEHGYHNPLGEVILRVLKQAGVEPRQVQRLVLPSPDSKSHLQLAKKLGFAAEQVQDVFWDDIALAGTATPLLLLSAALESAAPGDLILVAGQGNGADAFLFRATEAIATRRPHVPLAEQRCQGISYPTYTLYSKAREYRHLHEDGLEITNIFYAREEQQNIRLRGSQCGHCGTRHFPQTRMCARCQKGDALAEVALARTGSIFTFAVDSLAASPFPPSVMAVVELDGGGRIYCEVADIESEKAQIGMPVELVVRRLREGGGLYHYYWKCRPRRRR